VPFRTSPSTVGAVLVLATALAAGCSRDAKPTSEPAPGPGSRGGGRATAASPQTQPAPTGPAKAVPGHALAQLALDHLGELQKATSLAEWKSTHKPDEITPYHASIAEPNNREWCVRAMAQVTVDGDRIMRRTAFFYPPPMPDTVAFPTEPPDQLLGQCRLGFVWIETADADAKSAAIVTGDVDQAIAANFGAGQTTATTNWFGSASWKHNARWRISDVTMVLASTDKAAWKPMTDGTADAKPDDVKPAMLPTRVFVAAAGPASTVRFDKPPAGEGLEAAEAQHRVIAARIDEALRLAARDAELEQPLRAFLEIFAASPTRPRALTPAERTAFIEALERWVTFSPDFPGQRRTAALLAADLLLQESYASAGWYARGQSAVRRQLQQKGATFAESTMAQVFVYTHSWLKDAERLNAGGRAGELAFLTMISMGFETSGMCRDQGANGFLEVIRRGETYLRSHPNATIATELRFVIAQAHADIVALAAGAGESFTDADAWKPDVERARSRALEEFKLAYAGDASSPQVRALWPTVWRLAAGIAPTRTRFFCIYD